MPLNRIEMFYEKNRFFVKTKNYLKIPRTPLNEDDQFT